MADYFLETARLGFRRWSPDDVPLALALWGDPAVTRWIGGPWSDTEVEARLTAEIERQADSGMQYWPVFLRSNGAHVGAAGLRPYRPTEAIFEIGVHLLSAYWGRGLATEASRAVIAHAFGPLGAAALFAGHNPGNHDSRRLLLKFGFSYTHDEYYVPTGLRHPSYLLGRGDWERHARSGAPTAKS